jgi:hypothetical protein
MPAAGAPAAPDGDALARTSLEVYLKSADPAANARKVAAARAELAKLARTKPGTQAVASVLLSRGLRGQELAQVLGRAKAWPVEAEIKTPLGDTEHVMTIWLSQRALAEAGGTADEQLSKALGHQRWLAGQRAAESQDAATADTLRKVAESRQLRYYRIDAVGSAAGLARLLDERDVAAAFVDVTPARVSAVVSAKASLAEMRIGPPIAKSRPERLGPPALGSQPPVDR